jgi:hypothetical protein
MTELARRRAFLGVAVLVGAAALVPALSVSPSRDGKKAAVRERPMVLAVAGASNSGSPRRSVSNRSRTGVHAPARQRALAFVRAFLHYQRGGTASRTRAALARTTAASLARYLAVGPAGPVGTMRDAELLALHLYERGRTEVKASALLGYGRRRSLFEFRLRRGRDGWRVAELYR